MKNNRFNRLISFFLAASIFAVCPTALADVADGSAESAVIGTDEYSALEFMGFLCDDFAQGTASGGVPRADFAASLVKISGTAVTVHTAGDIPFSDINTASKHADEVCTLYDMGIIGGTGNRLFSPDEPITYSQAVKLCTDVLGYREYAMARYGGYPEGYLLAAHRIGLDEGISAQSDAALNAEDAVRLLYNAARTEVLEPNSYNAGGDVTYRKDERKELLAYAHDIYYDEGIMQDNGIVSIASDVQNSGKAVVDGEAYNIGKIDLTALIGCKVKFFYKLSGSSKTLLWAAAHNDCDVFTVRSRDLATDDPKYTSTNIVYSDGTKNRNLTLSNYAAIVYNNKLSNGYVPIAPKTGTVRFIDNNGDGTYDVAAVEEFSTLVVVSVSPTGNFISGKYNNSLKLDDYENVSIYKDGRKATIDDIGGNCTVSYIRDASSKNIYLYVNPKGVTDKLISVSDDGECRLEFNGGEFALNAEYEAMRAGGNYHFDELNIGGRYTYYLDQAGDIAELAAADNHGPEYAYLVDIAEHNAVFEDKAADLKLVLTDGTRLTATTAKNLIIDGAADKKGTDLLNDSRIVDGGDTIHQIVKVAFDTDGMINEIDIADSCTSEYGYDERKFTLDYSGKLRFDTESNSFGFIYPYYEDTPMFAEYSNIDDDDNVYLVTDTNSLLQNRTVPVRLYDCDSTMRPAVCALSLDAAQYDDRIVLVDSVRKVLGDDGCEYKKLIGLSFGLEYEIAEKNFGIIPNGIKRGDILHITSLNNTLVRADLVCRLSESPAPFRDKTFDKLGSVYGQIYSVNSNGVVTLNPDSMVADYGRLLATSFNGSGGVGDSIQIYDARSDKVRSGVKSDIAQISSPDANGDLPDTGSNVMIYIYRRFEYAKDVVIVYY